MSDRATQRRDTTVVNFFRARLACRPRLALWPESYRVAMASTIKKVRTALHAKSALRLQKSEVASADRSRRIAVPSRSFSCGEFSCFHPLRVS